MKVYDAQSLRNVAFVGHSGSGKPARRPSTQRKSVHVRLPSSGRSIAIVRPRFAVTLSGTRIDAPNASTHASSESIVRAS